jgi:hypothetical protein
VGKKEDDYWEEKQRESDMDRDRNLYLEGEHGEDFPDTWLPHGKTFRELRDRLPRDWSPSRPYTAVPRGMLAGLPDKWLGQALDRLGVPPETTIILDDAKMYGFDEAAKRVSEYMSRVVKKRWDRIDAGTAYRPETKRLLAKIKQLPEPLQHTVRLIEQLAHPVCLTDEEIASRQKIFSNIEKSITDGIGKLSSTMADHHDAGDHNGFREAERFLMVLETITAAAKKRINTGRVEATLGDTYDEVLVLLKTLGIKDREQEAVLLDLGFSAEKSDKDRLRVERVRLRKEGKLKGR